MSLVVDVSSDDGWTRMAKDVEHERGRVAEPTHIAGPVAFLCGNDAAFITGQSIVVDGGCTRSADRLLQTRGADYALAPRDAPESLRKRHPGGTWGIDLLRAQLRLEFGERESAWALLAPATPREKWLS